MIEITSEIFLRKSEIKFTFIRSPGAGGQNVNKVSTAVQLRFNVLRSNSLPEEVRDRLLSILGKRITLQGELVIKSNRYRTQGLNKEDAINKLRELIKQAVVPPKPRKKTKATFSSVQRRLALKKRQGEKKSLRGRDPKNDH